MQKIKVGSRDSKLAIIQAEIVIAAIKSYDPTIQIELITMKTTGDKILDLTLDKIGGKGLFVKELDQALHNGEVDITVHSYKDMPVGENPQLPVIALSKREDARDVLILPQNSGIKHLQGKSKTDITTPPIGSSSLRRKLQLRTLYPDCETAPIRGNVQTRLNKLEKGDFSAIVLAAAGIKRLGLEHLINRYFSIDEILPAASQGIIAVQGRDGEKFDYLKLFHSSESHYISLAERSFTKELDGGCSSPIGAYAELDKDEIILKGLYYDEETDEIIKESICGNKLDAIGLGIELARRIKSK
ncbi:MAG TPA: hydroxymethylbilane synthase [Ruminiclostridium sp.]